MKQFIEKQREYEGTTLPHAQTLRREEMDREQLTLRMPEQLKKALHREAQEKGISLNTLIIQILSREANHGKLHSP